MRKEEVVESLLYARNTASSAVKRYVRDDWSSSSADELRRSLRVAAAQLVMMDRAEKSSGVDDLHVWMDKDSRGERFNISFRFKKDDPTIQLEESDVDGVCP